MPESDVSEKNFAPEWLPVQEVNTGFLSATFSKSFAIQISIVGIIFLVFCEDFRVKKSFRRKAYSLRETERALKDEQKSIYRHCRFIVKIHQACPCKFEVSI